MRAIHSPSKLFFLDSHTEGEPTRLILGGGPNLGLGSMADRLRLLRSNFDFVRSASVNEPRGSDVIVGALLCKPVDQECTAGVIFFNNVGYLGMCGHGMIGLVTSLAYLGRISTGVHRIETPVGTVSATLHGSGKVTIQNVPSYRYLKGIMVEVPEHGTVTGDVAWGGNWFFLVEDHRKELTRQHVEELMQFAWDIRQALVTAGITGRGGAEIDHIELFAHPTSKVADSTNFVLCPGKSYDRSPCGTGTSAKMACLHADGLLAAGQIWKQQGILGGIFEGSYQNGEHCVNDVSCITPSITGSAYVMAEGALLLDQDDPFRTGIAK